VCANALTLEVMGTLKHTNKNGTKGTSSSSSPPPPPPSPLSPPFPPTPHSSSSHYLQISVTDFQIFRPLLERFGGTFDYRIISRLVNVILHKENMRIVDISITRNITFHFHFKA
jgi:hypothetical protein